MKRIVSWLVVLGVAVVQTIGIVPKTYAAGSVTITGQATIDSYVADALSVCFYPYDGTGSSQCSHADTSGNYSITVLDSTAYDIDLVGRAGNFQFKSSSLHLATPQSGTLNITVQTKALHMSLLDVFGNPVTGASTHLSTFAIDPVNNYSNIAFSASGLAVTENLYTNWAHSSDDVVTDSQGKATYIGLVNFAYDVVAQPPAGSFYQPSGAEVGSAFDFGNVTMRYPYIIGLSSTADLITNDQPHILWQQITDAVSYVVYRKTNGDTSYVSNADIIATTANSDYLDQENLAEGHYVYYVSAINSNGQVIAFSYNGSFANIDRTPPTISGLTMKKKVGAKPVVINVASVFDNLSGSGIVAGEFYVDDDPGQGNGVPMTITGTPDAYGMTTTHIFTGLTKGGHTLFARTMDQAGNWSQTVQVAFNF